MHMCVMGIDFSCFYDFSIDIWNFSDRVIFLFISLVQRMRLVFCFCFFDLFWGVFCFLFYFVLNYVYYNSQSESSNSSTFSEYFLFSQTTECHCYTQEDFSNLEQSNVCQIPSCPGNSYDICGVSPYAMVFEKGNFISY